MNSSSSLSRSAFLSSASFTQQSSKLTLAL
jgi:hypothetical protein